MGDDRAELLRARDVIQRSARLGDRNELLGPRPCREVVIVGERLDSIAGLAGHDEQGAGQIGGRACPAHGFRIRAVEDVEIARAERSGEHVGDEAGPAHAAYERARQPVGTDRRGERNQVVPLPERFIGRAHPSEHVHWRPNIMRII